jgi:5-methylcytosine-specific restriction endonuclease McrA
VGKSRGAKRTPREWAWARFYREQAYWRQHGLCAWCGRFVPHKEATADHLVSYLDGGRATDENIVMSCAPCNNGRSNPYQCDDHVRLYRNLHTYDQHVWEFRRHLRRQARDLQKSATQ